MREQDLLDELQSLTGPQLGVEIRAWVHSTQELPLRALLTAQGIEVERRDRGHGQRLGLRVSEAGRQCAGQSRAARQRGRKRRVWRLATNGWGWMWVPKAKAAAGAEQTR
jgi:hypothetical protein